MTQQRVSPIAVTSLLPATPVLSLTAASGQSANLVTLNNSSGTALATISASGLATFPNVAVSSTTIPTNGIYLPAANTLGFATNSAVRMQINASGEIATGASPSAGIGLQLLKNITGATASYVINSIGFIQSDVTSSATYYRTFARTANSNFSISSISHYDASAVSTFDNVTAGGSITAQYGFRVTNGLIGATSNYGFYGDIASGSNRYNLYMNGTAANYMAGILGIGTLPSSTAGLFVGNNPTGSLYRGVLVASVVQSDVTSTVNNFESASYTAAASFTLSNYNHYYATQGGLGATSTVTNQIGFNVGSNLTGATNNYGFYGNIASGSNRWNLYMNGTAANYFAGQTTVGSTSLTLGSGSVAQQFGVVSAAATNVGVVVRGAASQSGNLTEWQTSDGTIYSRIDSSGQNLWTYAIRPQAHPASGAIIQLDSNQIRLTQQTAGAIAFIVKGAASQTADLQQWQNSTPTTLARVTAAGGITSAAATAGIGYETGAGGTATQGAGSGKSTAVTLSKVTGQVTMNNAALAANTTVSFVLTNTAITATDMVYVSHISGGTLGSYTCTAAPAAGSATIYVRNVTAGSLSEAIVLQFVVIKAVTA
jgi:hypothetical protein